jgi:carbonic anhydrase/acetyltransferase-like protein (isoleucine patch superfamily)
MLYGFDNKRPTIGHDTYVSEHALVIGDVEIGDNCYIGHGAIIRGDYGSIIIGPGTAVEEGVIIHAPPQDFCRIGERVTFGHGAIIHAESVGNNVVIGMGAVLSIRSRVGEETIVAEGSVVRMRQSVPGGVVVGGNPAKVVRKLSAEDKEYWSGAKHIYIDLAKKYLDQGMEQIIP